MTGETSVPWRIARYGGLDQVVPFSAADLHRLGTLDRKLWVALSCPIDGLEFAEETLSLLDRDKDGRVRVEELAAAAAWIADRLADPAIVYHGPANLPLTAFSDNDNGKAMAAAARRVLANLDLATATNISATETADTARIFAKTEFNGDGVVTVHQVDEEDLRVLVTEILTCLPPAKDRSGEDGVDKATVEAFAADLDAFEAWWKVGEEAAAQGSDILPLGEDSPAAFAALIAVEAKLADWFARGRLASFDPRAAEPLNRDAAAYAAIADRDLSTLGPDIEALPLRRVEAGAPFRFGDGINPAWAERIAAFRAKVVAPLSGADETLPEASFAEMRGRFTRFRSWTQERKGERVEKLGIARIRAIRGGDLLPRLLAAIDRDLAVAGDLSGLDDLHRLLHYVRDFGRLLRNYVHFADFYDPSAHAVFQAGTLFIDQRSCELCVRVQDVATHAALAIHSRLYLLYCDCTRAGEKPIRIVAAVTQGDSDYLVVGRRGVFCDTRGRNWDAVVTKTIESPISIRQAFWLPYRKLIRLVESQIEKLAAAKEKDLETQAAAKVTAASTAPTPAGPTTVTASVPAKPPFDVAKMVGIFAAIGLALGAIGAAIGALVTAIGKLDWWQQLLILPGVILAISLPSMVLAWLKLRQRTLGPVLEGSGWAINARVRITFALGRVLTGTKRLPPNSVRSGSDPYAESTSLRSLSLLIVLLLILAGILAYHFRHVFG